MSTDTRALICFTEGLNSDPEGFLQGLTAHCASAVVAGGSLHRPFHCGGSRRRRFQIIPAPDQNHDHENPKTVSETNLKMAINLSVEDSLDMHTIYFLIESIIQHHAGESITVEITESEG